MYLKVLSLTIFEVFLLQCLVSESLLDDAHFAVGGRAAWQDSGSTAGVEAEACWYRTIPCASSCRPGCSQYVPLLSAVFFLTSKNLATEEMELLCRLWKVVGEEA